MKDADTIAIVSLMIATALLCGILSVWLIGKFLFHTGLL